MRRSLLLAALSLVVVAMMLVSCAPAATPTQPPAPTKAAQPTAGAQPTSPPPTQAVQPTSVPPTQAPQPTAGPKVGGTLTIGMSAAPSTVDPHASISSITSNLLASSGESLLYLNDKNELEPWLAESWEVSSDAKVYTFKLRHDVTFQDGTPFNAEAVKWNLDRINSGDYTAGLSKSYMPGYEGTDVVDEYTVQVRFATGYIPFLTNIASPFLSMLSPTATEAQGVAVNETPVLTGPYRATEYVANDHFTVERWDGYTRQAPWSDHVGPGYVDKIIYKFIPEAGTRVATLESGECQVIMDVPAPNLSEVQALKDVTIQSAVWGGTGQIVALNVTKPPTDNVKVRQAVEYALNRQALADTLFKGVSTPAIGMFTALTLNQPILPTMYPYDVTKAQQLLAEAGYDTMGPDGFLVNKNGEQLVIELATIDMGAGAREQDVWVQSQLQAIGINCKLKVQARAAWLNDLYGCATNGSIFWLRYTDFDGIAAMLDSQFIGTFINVACVSNPDMDTLLAAGRVETDRQKRVQLYVDVETMALENAYYIPLIDDLSVWAVRNEVTGLKFNGFTYEIAADMHFTN